MSTITTGNIPRTLQEGIKDIFGNAYNEHATQWNKLFESDTTNKNFEVDVMIDGFGVAPVKREGEGVSYDTQSQGYVPKYPVINYSNGFIVSEEAREDNLYNLFDKGARGLARSMNQTKENVGANVYNRGFNSSFTMEGGDGLELFSLVHVNGPNDTTTFANELTVAAALSETSLEDLIIDINQATDPRGLKIALQAMRLIVPPALAFEADRITKSELQSGTGNNDINAIRNISALREGYMVNNYLTSDTAWFIKTDAPDGMKHFERRAVRFEQDLDFGTSNSRFKASERYAFGWSDPRGAYGTAGA